MSMERSATFTLRYDIDNDKFSFELPTGKELVVNDVPLKEYPIQPINVSNLLVHRGPDGKYMMCVKQLCRLV